jgi:hypothetical protein
MIGERRFPHPRRLAMTKHRWSQPVRAAGLTVLVMFATSATRSRVAVVGPILSVTPTAVTFDPTVVGGFNYQFVTITNSGDAADYITTATASPYPPFFATFAGTCNTSIDPNNQQNYYIPPGFSCTFEWGFNPAKPGRRPGTGTLVFQSGATLAVTFAGVATPH